MADIHRQLGGFSNSCFMDTFMDTGPHQFGGQRTFILGLKSTLGHLRLFAGLSSKVCAEIANEAPN